MADGISCDRCGAGLLIRSNVRYVVTIDVRAAWDPLELTAEDIAEDHLEEMRRLMRQMQNQSPDELQDQVHRTFRFDLCPECQKAYLKRPLP